MKRIALSLAAAACFASSAQAGPILDVTTPGSTSFIVTTTGIYSIEIFGANGGASRAGQGGAAAHLMGNFFLGAGQALSILVGARGGSIGGGGGGGGGTFVVSGTTPLIVAGGGGGEDGAGGHKNAQLGNDGGGASGYGGGSGGGGGFAYPEYSGGGGGGLLGDGLSSAGGGQGGASFFDGGAGGAGAGGASSGGVGGGGGAWQRAGGGGGYSGGTGGLGPGDFATAGGGGSYFDGLQDGSFLAELVQGLHNDGNGEFRISLVAVEPAVVAEPASVSLLAAGMAALLVLGRRRRAAVAHRADARAGSMPTKPDSGNGPLPSLIAC